MNCCGSIKQSVVTYTDIHTEEKVSIDDYIMNGVSLDFYPDKFLEQLKLENQEINAQTIDNTDAISIQQDEKLQSKHSETVSESSVSLEQQEQSSETSFESSSSEIPEEEQNNDLKRNPDLLIKGECEQVKNENNMINNFKQSESYQTMSKESKKAAELIINYIESDVNNLELSDDQRVCDIKRKIQTDYSDFIKVQEQNAESISLLSTQKGLEASMIQRQNQISSYSPAMTINADAVDQLSFKENVNQDDSLSISRSENMDEIEKNIKLQSTNIRRNCAQAKRDSYIQSTTNDIQLDGEKAKIYKQYLLSIIKLIQNLNIYDAKNIIKIEKIQKQRIERDVKIKDFNLYKNKICEVFYIDVKYMQNLSQLKQVQIIYNFLIENKEQLIKKQKTEEQIDQINSENIKYNPNKTSPNLRRKQMLISDNIYMSKELQNKLYELINMYTEGVDDATLYETIVNEYRKQANNKQSTYVL